MLHIPVVVDQLNLEMLLSHEAIIANKEKNLSIYKNSRNYIMDKLSRKEVKTMINTYKAAN
jgi:hypothetical protein